MRLLEAILKANQAAAPGAVALELSADETTSGLPLVALTCIDPRLNTLIPQRLGIPEEQFIWLRNAGNIVTGPLSSTTRSLALACAIKGGKEIAVVGHSDCLVCKTTVLSLTEALRRLGIERGALPENLVEYFGLFASERQNVMRAVEIIRSSPLIGAQVPVHGLLLDLATGRLEWVVNGYQGTGSVARSFMAALGHAVAEPREEPTPSPEMTVGSFKTPEVRLGDVDLPELKVGGLKLPEIKVTDVKLPSIEVTGLKLPEIKVGGMTFDPNRWLSQVRSSDRAAEEAAQPAEVKPTRGEPSPEETFDKTKRYKVIGSDQKVYGPINGLKILQWIGEGRIGWDTPSQVEGSSEWRPLSLWSAVLKQLLKPRPPRLPGEGKRRDRP